MGLRGQNVSFSERCLKLQSFVLPHQVRNVTCPRRFSKAAFLATLNTSAAKEVMLTGYAEHWNGFVQLNVNRMEILGP